MNDDAVVEATKKDFRRAPLDIPTVRLLEYAEKITRDAAKMTKEDTDVLRKEGFSDEAILDAACIAAYFNYINRMSDALGVELEEVFEEKQK